MVLCLYKYQNGTMPLPNNHEKMDMKNRERGQDNHLQLVAYLSKDGNTVVFSYKIFPK